MRLLDLFCGAGGAAMGYHRAGFDVVGVDIDPQPNYPFEFHQADATAMVQDVMNGCWHEGTTTALPERLAACLGHFDAIHASPPCQHYSVTKALHDAATADLYELTRDRLEATGVPWVIENVVGAPYQSGIVLCGSMFGLGVWRHRNFESSVAMFRPPCRHDLVPEPIDVTGTGGQRIDGKGRKDGFGGDSRKPLTLTHARDVMGIDWMTRRELSQAIPPAYTHHVGAQLIDAIQAVAA